MLPIKCYKEIYIIPFNTTKLVFTHTSSFYLFVETTKIRALYALRSIGSTKQTTFRLGFSGHPYYRPPLQIAFLFRILSSRSAGWTSYENDSL